jgi:hypothetical protein
MITIDSTSHLVCRKHARYKIPRRGRSVLIRVRVD